jgi:hypothetical protein
VLAAAETIAGRMNNLCVKASDTVSQDVAAVIVLPGIGHAISGIAKRRRKPSAQPVCCQQVPGAQRAYICLNLIVCAEKQLSRPPRASGSRSQAADVASAPTKVIVLGEVTITNREGVTAWTFAEYLYFLLLA